MNNAQIDIRAVSFLNIDLTNHEKIMPFINYNDKTPTWDGEIYLYEDSLHSKTNIKKVPVQVKGKKVLNLDTNFISYPVSKIDMQNFLLNDGAIFFVVLMKNEKHRLFYKTLLPQDIDPILESFTKSQKTKNIKFKSIENKDLPLILKHFLTNRIVNCPIYSFEIIEKTGGSFTAKASIPKKSLEGLSDSKKIETILNHPETYIYAINENIPNNLLPISKKGTFKVDSAVRHLRDNVILDGKQYNVFVSSVEEDNEVKIFIGANSNYEARSIIIYVNDKIDITIKGTLDQRITDMEFSIKCFKNALELSGEKDNFMKLYGQFVETRKTFDEVGIKSDVDISNFSDEDWQNLSLINLGLNNKPTGMQDGWQLIRVADFEFLFIVTNQGERLINPYTFNGPVKITRENINGTKDEAQISLFFAIEKNKFMFYKFSNTNYDFIYNSLISSEKSHFVKELSLDILCNMIKTYDEGKADDEVLKLAVKFGNWLFENIEINKEYLQLNILQALKRLNNLTPKDFAELGMLIKNEDALIRFAAFTLLEEKENASAEIFNKENFDILKLENMPIFTLYNKL